MSHLWNEGKEEQLETVEVREAVVSRDGYMFVSTGSHAISLLPAITRF